VVDQIVYEIVKKRVAEFTPPVTVESDLRDDLNLDSMELLTISIEIERQIGVDIMMVGEAEHLVSIRTVGDLANLVSKYAGGI